MIETKQKWNKTEIKQNDENNDMKQHKVGVKQKTLTNIKKEKETNGTKTER